MAIEIKVPLLPESVSDAMVANWHKKVGEVVKRDENLVDLETDKVMLEVPAPADGILKEIKINAGTTVKAEVVIGIIEAGAVASEQPVSQATGKTVQPESVVSVAEKTQTISHSATSAQASVLASPSVRKKAVEQGISLSDLMQTQTGASLNKETVLSTLQSCAQVQSRVDERVPMSRMRAKIAERLLDVKQNTAMLTTFNEVNMQPVMEMRNRYKEIFEKKHQVKLGFMSFFVRACAEALKRFSIVNASIDGQDIIYHGYQDIGVAVSTERGLVVPILRDADQLSMAGVEKKIAEFAEKARANKLSLEDMQGGTFTITNGGVFGSLLSTPLLNSPQSAILGMHKIQERVMVEKGQMLVRPMMYLALSYDHRLIDGKDSVSFLVAVKELLEDPTRLLLEV